MSLQEPDKSIGVIVVTFNAADVIGECLDSLTNQTGAAPFVAVVDNSSADTTVQTVRDWDAGRGLVEEMTADEIGRRTPAAPIVLIHSGANRGFAGGVNVGLKFLALRPEVQHFWVLNPDAFADPGASAAILGAAARAPDYGLIGGRVCYAEPPHRIQIDGGTVNRLTGVTSNINLGAEAASATFPQSDQIDFVTGANLVASRRFYEAIGPMREDYFLYYEEADWALRRGALKIIAAPDFVVYHHAGTSIGSPTLERLASPFSFWFKYRSRMKFVRRFYPLSLPVALAYATAKAGQLFAKGARPQATALLSAIYGLPAPRSVRERLSPEAAQFAFGHRAED